jgi:hypothetical protein
MKQINWYIILGGSLVFLSVTLYVVQISIFHRTGETFFYLLQDLAFIPMQVLLVTLIISGLLNMREKRLRLEKLNMVIGTFFSEVGTRLIAHFSDFDPKLENIRTNLIVRKEWSDQEFVAVIKRLKDYDYEVTIHVMNLEDLRIFLMAKRDFLVRLLENPILLEHESFTELLRAVFHLTEELAAREDLQALPDTDRQHLAGDVKRVYNLLVHEWLNYMQHLKDNYPYLFSLAMRINPFDQDASVIVK